MPNKEEKRITEQSSLYEHLEKMSVDELTAHINAENKKVALAIEQALPAINQLISVGGLCWWRHQRRHTPRRTGQAAGRGGRETHPSAGSLHRPGTVSGPLQDRQPYQGI